MSTKVTLSSGKVVILRELKISHSELAAQAAAARAGENMSLLSMLMQKELVKVLILQVDGKAPTATEREDIDSLLTAAEYYQLSSVIKKLIGGDEKGKEPLIEVGSFGDK